jgi:hypothetical protein
MFFLPPFILRRTGITITKKKAQKYDGCHEQFRSAIWAKTPEEVAPMTLLILRPPLIGRPIFQTGLGSCGGAPLGNASN